MTELQKYRLKHETEDLAVRYNKLQDFMKTGDFYSLDKVQMDLLYDQDKAMLKYLQILRIRCGINGIPLNMKRKE